MDTPPAAHAGAQSFGTEFRCRVCNFQRPLKQLLDLDCFCLVCSTCCDKYIAARLLHIPAAKPAAPEAIYSVGQQVRYRQSNGAIISAKVMQVDRSIQPYGYGIQLEGAADVRFTEHTRLLSWDLHSEASTTWMEQGLPAVSCPACAVSLDRPQLSRICPLALQQLDEALTNAWLEAKGIICCPTPGCEALIEKLPADPSVVSHCSCASSSSNSSHSSTDSTCSSCWKLYHRYRCPACSKSFCDVCRRTPYHEGLTCREAAAPCCHFCGVRMPEVLDLSTAGLSNKDLQNETQQLGADAKWCLERSELVAVYLRAKQVCQGCRVQFSRMCTKQLACGHWCCGVRGISPCLPCLQAGCDSQAGAAGDGSCCFCFEPLPVGAVVELACSGGHFVHVDCAKRRLQVGCPGPALTFDYLFCPLCGSGKEGRCGNIQVMTAQPHLMHSQLQAELAQPLQLRDQVVHLAKARLHLSGMAKQDEELQPGGRFDGRPADYAIAKYLFYQCSRCHLPYFGGAKECGEAPQQQPLAGPPVFDAHELICGSCSAAAAGADCPQHGRQFVEWKCKYCCNLASWFCWGSTHMCSSCHDHPNRRHGNTCPGAGRCALKVPHPFPGEDCCLGCGVCRYSG